MKKSTKQPVNLPNEEWRDIPGYDGEFQVSNLGRIRKLTIRKQVNTNGYSRIQLYGKDFPVHRLVAEAFIGECPEGKQVNHKDGKKANNCDANLEYVTAKENIRHAIEVLNRKLGPKPKYEGKKINADEVREIRRLYEQGDGFTYMKLASMFGVTHGMIGHIVRRELWTHVK